VGLPTVRADLTHGLAGIYSLYLHLVHYLYTCFGTTGPVGAGSSWVGLRFHLFAGCYMQYICAGCHVAGLRAVCKRSSLLAALIAGRCRFHCLVLPEATATLYLSPRVYGFCREPFLAVVHYGVVFLPHQGSG